MPYRRTYPGKSLLTAAAAAAVSLVAAASALAATPAAAAPIPLPMPMPIPLFGTVGQAADDLARGFPAPAPARRAASDRLTVTVTGSGSSEANGTFRLRCHPAGGSHRDPARACAKLDKLTRWGRDTFAPVPKGSMCTMIYGDSATAHVTGTWAGRPVDARFQRTNGCEIARWNRFEPLLPHPAPRTGS
ncbi:SSI family serine proteinase inhibitor [Streptomyces chattanoogensis]|uniref:SSI family serine proteinase inhibitor n=1 Tax=Streptomyces chattanoogensis TaxID=66876 RepID=UPI0036C39F2A